MKHLTNSGHKASLSELQFVQEKVVFLGHVITSEGKTLSSKRVDAIQNLPKPITKRQMMSFLGMCSYCRQFISNYAILEAPLVSLIHGKDLQSQDKISWTLEESVKREFVNALLILTTQILSPLETQELMLLQKELQSNPLSLIHCFFQLQSLFPAPLQQYSPLPHHKKRRCGDAVVPPIKTQCGGTNLACLNISFLTLQN